jgi:hypothetical protein
MSETSEQGYELRILDTFIIAKVRKKKQTTIRNLLKLEKVILANNKFSFKCVIDYKNQKLLKKWGYKCK